MSEHSAEKNSSEQAVLRYFLDAAKLKGSIEKSESPDFILHCPNNTLIGIEITLLAENEEAQVLHGRGSKIFMSTTEDLVIKLNDLLAQKANKYKKYKKFDRNILVLRVGDFMLKKEDFERLKDSIIVPSDSFDEIYLLLFNTMMNKWADLLELTIL